MISKVTQWCIRLFFSWTDQTPLDYRMWDRNEPNNYFGAERCVEMRTFRGGKFLYSMDKYCHFCLRSQLKSHFTKTADLGVNSVLRMGYGN